MNMKFQECLLLYHEQQKCDEIEAENIYKKEKKRIWWWRMKKYGSDGISTTK